MANNRVYIACVDCVENDRSDFMIYIAKYYPKVGWYPTGEDWGSDIEKWLEDHSHHVTNFGYDERDRDPFFLFFESGDRPQDMILKELSEAFSKKE